MIRLRSLQLRNYCGFKNANFDFTKDGTHKNLVIFYGPNGSGKSTVLQAIYQLGNPEQYRGRSCDLLLRKMTFNPDYQETEDNWRYVMKRDIRKADMIIEGTFDTDDGPKRVVIGNHSEAGSGVLVNDFPPDKKYLVFSTDADNPMNTCRFQLNQKYQDTFLDIAEAVYGYKCELPSGNFAEVEEYDADTGEYIIFKTDLIIHKEEAKVHFKRMSAGEKKIATMLAMLCSPLHYDRFDIFLIDNVAMHVYVSRHETLIDKLRQHFSGKQIFATTHSAVMIDHIGYTLGTEYLYGVHKKNRWGQDLTEDDKKKISEGEFNFWR